MTAPPTVQADGNGDAVVDHSEEARERFRRGVALFNEGAFRSALIEFRRAYELKPSFALFSNIGQTYLELGDYLAARDALRSYLDMGGPEVPPERRATIERQLELLQARIAALAITVDVEGAEVFVDDEPVGKSPIAQALSVNMGRHKVRVRSSDGEEQSQVVDVAGGDVRELSFQLQQRDEEAVATVAPAPRGDPARRVMPASKTRHDRYRKIILGSAIGGGVLAAGTIAAVVLQQRELRAYEQALDTPDVDPNEVAVHRTNVWWRAVTVDALAGLTLVAAGTGVTFWLLDRSAANEERAGSVRIGISGRQLRLTGVF